MTRDAVVHLPVSLDAALQRFAAPSSISREIMGDYLVDHFSGTRQHELRVYNKSVTSWEGEYDYAHDIQHLIPSRTILRAGVDSVHVGIPDTSTCMSPSGPLWDELSGIDSAQSGNAARQTGKVEAMSTFSEQRLYSTAK